MATLRARHEIVSHGLSAFGADPGGTPNLGHNPKQLLRRRRPGLDLEDAVLTE
jgi:hypothetical protein